MSSIVNKIKEAVHPDTKSAPEGTHGPHSNRMANAADPRVDSDRDGSHRIGGTTGTSDTYTSSSNYTYGGSGHGHDGPASGTAGPHQSNLANKVDPRVDSDRDGSRTMGNTGTTTTGTTGFGSGFGHDGTSRTTGPHQSNMANKMDPRVDSDRDGSRTLGAGTGGLTGNRNAPEGTYGPHGSRMANAADPRVDSDRDGSHHMGTGNTMGRAGAAIGGTHGTGPAPNTAGPHKSDFMNKADPRVDSDLDGSNTYGTNKTYSQSSNMTDPTDAAQVPPSVLRRHIGEPVIAHDDHTHHRERRNSTTTHQEQFRGI